MSFCSCSCSSWSQYKSTLQMWEPSSHRLVTSLNVCMICATGHSRLLPLKMFELVEFKHLIVSLETCFKANFMQISPRSTKLTEA